MSTTTIVVIYYTKFYLYSPRQKRFLWSISHLFLTLLLIWMNNIPCRFHTSDYTWCTRRHKKKKRVGKSNGFLSTCTVVGYIVAIPVFCGDVFLLNTVRMRFKPVNLARKKMNYFIMGNNNYVRPQRLQRNILRFQKRKCVYCFSNLARPHP